MEEVAARDARTVTSVNLAHISALSTKEGRQMGMAHLYECHKDEMMNMRRRRPKRRVVTGVVCYYWSIKR